jgi:hypothetical protein
MQFARSIWLVIQLGSTLYQPRSVTDIIENWPNDVDPRFKLLIRVGALGVIWSVWLCKNDKFLNDKLFYYACYLPVHNFAPFMVIFITCGESRSIYGGIYAVGDHGEGYFYLTLLAVWCSDWPSITLCVFTIIQTMTCITPLTGCNA